MENTDKIKFRIACEKVVNKEHKKNGIGTLGEKTLHAVLKNYYEPHKENQEVKIGGYVADISGENGVIEIQTQSFNRLLEKLEAFLEFCNVTVVYPILKEKYVNWLDCNTGEIVDRRKSPRKGSIYDCFPELYKIKYTLDNPRFTLCLCILQAEEIRSLGSGKNQKNRKKTSSKYDKIPTDILDEIYLDSPKDYHMFIPCELKDKEFTVKDFAEKCRIDRKTAGIALNILTYLETVRKTGKQGRSILYKEN